MNDTPAHIRRLYADFIMSKSDAERFQMSFEMADIGQQLTEQQVRQNHPNWSIGEVKAAVFERIYRMDFSEQEMIRIKADLLTFHQINS